MTPCNMYKWMEKTNATSESEVSQGKAANAPPMKANAQMYKILFWAAGMLLENLNELR